MDGTGGRAWVNEDPEASERWFDVLERVWQDHTREHGIVVPVVDIEDVGPKLEVTQFAFGLTAALMRSVRAQLVLLHAGFVAEPRPMFRMAVELALALTELERSGVHAVHAYGYEQAYRLTKLREASARGFAIGARDEEYIERFLALTESLAPTKEDNAAKHAVKTATIGKQGNYEAILYQAWLDASRHSHPSMSLVDLHWAASALDEGIRLYALTEGPDTSEVVDPRIVLAMLTAPSLTRYARIIEDDDLLMALARLDPRDVA